MAWAEIKFDKLGWQPFYPTPGRSGAKDDHDVVSSSIQESEELEDEFGRSGAERPQTSTRPQATGRHEEPASGLSPGVIAAVAGGVLLVAYAGVVAGLPWWRRRARRPGPGPESRVLGAWRQTCDDLGLTGRYALTAEDVITHSTRPLTAPRPLGRRLAATHPVEPDDGRPHPQDEISTHLRPLADISNFVRYAPDTITEATATTAWQHSDAIRRAVRTRTPSPPAYATTSSYADRPR
ncbi:hypothetical protein ABGB18_10675 [Nonomuraea sp. B12E4]|uniref:hypothetical protein n=1 Tax=Nonomuraea sp. B12E4 TaxID=3153564 RepID=UPI00325CC38A